MKTRIRIMDGSFEIRAYTEAGRSPFAEWFNGLAAVAAARVDRFLRRLEAGNLRAAEPLRDGVSELRLDFGPGYRVYFGRDGLTTIILLGGGSKRRQDAEITLNELARLINGNTHSARVRAFLLRYHNLVRENAKLRLPRLSDADSKKPVRIVPVASLQDGEIAGFVFGREAGRVRKTKGYEVDTLTELVKAVRQSLSYTVKSRSPASSALSPFLCTATKPSNPAS
jgi:putative addiction module killer protein